jgi:hypothetical protein
MLKKLRKTGEYASSTDQVPAPDVPSSTSPDVPHRSLSTAGSASLPSRATPTLQAATPTHRLAVMLDTAPSCQPVLSTELEETNAKPAARPLVCQATRWSPAGCPASLRTRSLDVPAPVFGAQAWRQYFGEVGTEPPLPSDINQILSGPCPFWSGKLVQDTHLLVLIPSQVSGKPFSLNFLRKLIKRPQGGGHPTKYRYYDDAVQKVLGIQSAEGAYWVLMTHEVLEGSRDKRYDAQKALISAHASETGLSYELPGALEAATVMLSHYVRSGERLYADSPWIYTRCRELVDNLFPVIVGAFSSGGLLVGSSHVHDFDYYGVASLRKF